MWFSRSTLWTAFKLLVAILLVGLVVSQIRPSELVALGRRLVFPWAFGSLVFFYAGIWVMARRYWILLNRKIAFLDVVDITLVQTVVGNLIATSVGTVASIALLRSRHQVQLRAGVALILVARFCDLVLLLFTLALSSWLLWSDIQPLHGVVLVLMVGLGLLSLLTLMILVWREPFLTGLVDSIRRFIPLHIWGIRKLIQVLEDLRTADFGRVRELLGVVAWYTVLSFALMVGSAYCTLAFFGVSLGVWQIVFVLSLLLLMSFAPIQILGGLGIQEISLLYLYTLFGLNQPEMAAVVIGARMLAYVLNVVVLLHLPLETLWRTGNRAGEPSV